MADRNSPTDLDTVPPSNDDIAIYIDELKSDDPSLKLIACGKIVMIAEVLEAGRTREELVPYLTEIIEEYDNEDDFLIKLADQIVQLKDMVGGQQHVHLLLTPLEFIASIEEPKIREAAVKAVIQLVEPQEAAFYEEHFYLMVSRLVLWENYTSKISGAALIPLCFSKLSADKKESLRALVVDLSKDDIPMVRRAIASILDELLTIYSEDRISIDSIQEIAFEFLQDKIDSVRLKTLEQIPNLALHLNQATRDGQMIQLLLNMDKERKQWSVRYHLLEAVTNITELLSFPTIKEQLVPFLLEQLRDKEMEVRSVAVQKLAIFAKVMGKHQQLPEFKELMDSIVAELKKLSKDSSLYVKDSLIELMANQESTKFLFSEKALDEVVPEILTQLLKDENLKVKLLAVKNLSSFLHLFTEKSFEEKLFPLVKELKDHSNWKVREAFLLQNVDSLKNWEFLESKWDCYIGTLFEIRQDHVYRLRTLILEFFKEMYCQEHQEKLDALISEMMRGWSSHGIFLFRITSMKACLVFDGVIPDDLLREVVEDVFKNLEQERVYNVQYNMLKTAVTLLQRRKEAGGGRIVISDERYQKIIEQFEGEVDYDLSLMRNQLEEMILE